MSLLQFVLDSVSSSSMSSSSMSSSSSSLSSAYPQKLFLDTVLSRDIPRLRRILSDRHLAVNVDQFNVDGQTALHESCLRGDLELVEVLVGHGADAGLASRDGWNALHLAVYEGHIHIVRFLLRTSRPRHNSNNSSECRTDLSGER